MANFSYYTNQGGSGGGIKEVAVVRNDFKMTTTSFVPITDARTFVKNGEEIAFQCVFTFRNLESGARAIEFRFDHNNASEGNMYASYFNGANGYVRGCMNSSSTFYSPLTTAVTPPTITVTNELQLYIYGRYKALEDGYLTATSRCTSAASNGIDVLSGSYMQIIKIK